MIKICDVQHHDGDLYMNALENKKIPITELLVGLNIPLKIVDAVAHENLLANSN
jgi:hypothetical protein